MFQGPHGAYKKTRHTSEDILDKVDPNELELSIHIDIDISKGMNLFNLWIFFPLKVRQKSSETN